MKPSKKWSLNKADITAWGQRTLQVLAPYLIALLPVVIEKVPKDWAYATITVWLLQRVWDLFRRYYSGK